jgi:pimeloyl-ACP methyl ester carboxylesterase
VGWGKYLGQFAAHFRVIAPDTRGHGRTVDPSGVMSYRQFAEDLLALIKALQLEKPLLCGFSDGGIIASVASILAPDVPRAVVNLAGYDVFNPDPNAQNRVFARTWLGGGDPQATRTNLDWSAPPSPLSQRRIDDFEPAQGPGYVKVYYERVFEMWTKPMGFSMDDLAQITAPTLLLAGDRDEFCSVEEGVVAYRKLPQGELGFLPGQDHAVPPLACTMALAFLLRQSGSTSEPARPSQPGPAAEPAAVATTAPRVKRRWWRRGR